MFIEYSIRKYILVLSLNTHIPFKWSLSKLHTLRKQIRAHISLVCEHIESERIAVQMPCCTCSFMHTQTRTQIKKTEHWTCYPRLRTKWYSAERVCVSAQWHHITNKCNNHNANEVQQAYTMWCVNVCAHLCILPPPSSVSLGSLGLRLVDAIMRRILTTLCADLDRPVFVTRM